MKSSLFRYIVYASILLGGGCASHQEVIRADSRISSIEKSKDQFQLRMEDFRKSQMEKDQHLRNQYAELYATIDRLQEQIQLLNGKIEEKEHQNLGFGNNGGGADSKLANLEQEILAIKDRLLRVEEYLAMDGNAKKPMPLKPSPEKPPAKEKTETPPAKELPENELYAKAKQDFDSGELETARTGFQEFIKHFPKSAIADSAQFWLGEIYYRQKWYEKAILEYQKVIENYPKGNKVQASLLKQGFSFFNLGDKSNGRLILKELIGKYPSSNEAKIAKQKLEGS